MTMAVAGSVTRDYIDVTAASGHSTFALDCTKRRQRGARGMEADYTRSSTPRWSETFKSALAILFLVSFAGPGCFGISHDRYSKPSLGMTSLPIVHERYVGDMYVMGDVAFHVFPLNTMGSEFMLFPVPYHFAEPPKGAKPFSVGVAFKAKTEGYGFNPSSIKFWLDPAQPLSPTTIQGPYDCGRQKALPVAAPVTAKLIDLAAGSCFYMWLNFDTVAPDPAETFFVELTVNFQDRDVSLPVVQFQPKKRTTSFVLP